METRRIKIQTFLGLNNKEDPTRLAVDLEKLAAPLSKAVNVDIDRMGQVSRRNGFDALVSGSSVHSLWSNGSVCIYVDGSNLKQLHGDYTTSILRSGLTLGARMSYADDLSNRIYFSNGVVISSLAVGPDRMLTEKPMVDPQRPFKSIIPAGTEIEFYRGRLYVAAGNIIWFSDAAVPGRFDLRKNFKSMDGPITMMKAVEDGLYVADGQTYFLSGEGHKLERTRVADYNAIPGTAVHVDGKLMGGEGLSGRVLMWTSERGVCVGSAQGQFHNLTEQNYIMPSSRRGAGLFRQADGMNQYVSTLST